MKRSEMLKIMKKASESHYGEIIDADFEDRLVETILTAMEKNGMAPPELQPWDNVLVEYDDYGSPSYKYFYKGIRVKPDADRKWEPEDDNYCGAV